MCIFLRKSRGIKLRWHEDIWGVTDASCQPMTPGGGRGHVEHRSLDSQADRCHTNLHSTWWLWYQQYHTGCFYFLLSASSSDIPLSQSLQRKSLRLPAVSWAWNLCGKTRRIIRRLQLICSPRFSSGKKNSDSRVWRYNGVESSPVWQAVPWKW